MEQITGGTLRAGDALLSEKALSTQFRLSVRQVQLALARLVSEGWVHRRHRAGTYVSEKVAAGHEQTSIPRSQKRVVIMMPEAVYRHNASRMEYWAEVVQPLERYLGENGVAVSYTPQVEQNIGLFLAQEADSIGVVVMAVSGCQYESVRELGLPSVCVMCYPGIRLERNDAILTDEVASSYAATRYLLRLGHTRIGVITSRGDARTPHCRDRLDGYANAIAEAGLVVDDDLVIYTEWSVQGGYEGMLRILARGGAGISAVFAGNDLLAFGAMRALSESRLRVPEDMSIMGFDDWTLASHSVPSLTDDAR